MSMQFKCPECGNTSLFRTMNAVTTSRDRLQNDLWYEEAEIQYEEIVHYQCSNGHSLKNPDGTLVRDDEEIEAWTKNHSQEN